MKNPILSFIFLLLFQCLNAQAPQAFNYQAVVRDADGNTASGQDVSVRVSVLANSTTGTSVYSETHHPTTDELGLIAFAIGQGENTVGNFSNINWGGAPHFLKIEVDTDGGSNFSTLGTFQMLSVPYALYGRDEDSDPMNETISNVALNGTNLTITESGVPHSVDLGGSVIDNDADPMNEIISDVALNGTNLTITESGVPHSVDLGSLGGTGGSSYWQQSSAGNIFYEGETVKFRSGTTSDAVTLKTESNGSGSIVLYYPDNTRQAEISIDDTNYASAFGLYSPSGGSLGSTTNSFLGTYRDSLHDGLLLIYDNGRVISEIGSSLENNGYLALFSNESLDRDEQIIEITGYNNDPDAGYIGVKNNNIDMVHIGSDLEQRGRIDVYDEFGDVGAGIGFDINGSFIFAGVKNFVMQHPKQPEKQIWYASIEGPEAAAYERGTATLANGEMFIPFTETFELVVNPTTMTVNLTPLSADSKGLAVIEKTEKGIRVKELMQGTGNYSFDWEVKGVRKGYENYRVVRDKIEMRRPTQSHQAEPRPSSTIKRQELPTALPAKPSKQ